jgi:hypothetical protein
MPAIWIARSAFLVCVLTYFVVLAAGLARLIDPLLAMVLGGYASIAMGLAAAACVVVEIMRRIHRKP